MLKIPFPFSDWLQSSYHPIGEDDLHQFEEAVGHKLPNDYGDFLRQRNGGRLILPGIRCVSQYPLDEGDDERVSVTADWFYGLKACTIEKDLMAVRESYEDRVPPELLCVARREEDQVCVGMAGSDRDRVMLWDHEEDTRYVLADSLGEYLASYELHWDEYSQSRGDPLVDGILQGHAQTISTYLDGGGDPNRRDDAGQTLLMRAAVGRPWIIPVILEYGADIEAKDRDGETALCYAVTGGTIECAGALLEAGANARLPCVDELMRDREPGDYYELQRALLKDFGIPA